MTVSAPTGRDIAAEIGALRRYALVLTRDRDAAEDLVQESLARAIAGVRTWRPGNDLRRWLLAIVHNTHVSWRRRGRTEAAALEQAGWLAEGAAPAGQPERVHLGETVAALMALPEEQREALVLVAFDGVSYRDAADILGVPTGTLMSRLARGREALRAATGRGAGTAAEGPPRSRPSRLRVVE
jgi:RNA polymerase sigma-70 factor (ECF subfamily)